jgi:hypothetical protein
MNKKLIILLSLCLFFATACSNSLEKLKDKETQDSVAVVESKSNKPETTGEKTTQKLANTKISSKSTPKPLCKSIASLSSGKFSKMEFGVDSDIKNIILKYGSPKEKGTFGGSNYYSYDNTTYFTNYSKSDEGTVSKVSITNNTIDICGTKLGMTFDQIKKIIGNPSKEFHDSESDVYRSVFGVSENLDLVFDSDSKTTPVLSASLEKVGTN